MQGRSSSNALAAGVKRVRSLMFPSGFEQLLLWCLAARSPYIRAQLECMVDGAEGGLELPAEFGSLWLEGLLVTWAGMRATANAKVVQFLQVCTPETSNPKGCTFFG